MRKHKLIELRKIIEVRIGSLIEVEIATNAKLNELYVADQRDEIQFSTMDYKNNSVYLKSGLLRATTAWSATKANRNDGYDRIREYASRKKS